MRKRGNVVMIAPREELALREKQQLENAQQIAQLEPLISESFQLNYIKASDLQNIITTNSQQKFGAGAGQTATTGGQGPYFHNAASHLSIRARTFCSCRTQPRCSRRSAR